MARVKYKEAAGLEVKKGSPGMRKKPGKKELEKHYVKKSKSIREVAETLGCSKDMIFRALKEYGIELRPGFNLTPAHLEVNNKEIMTAIQ